MEYKRISADSHVDLCWMPPDLFVTEAAPAMRERMPFVTDGPDGPSPSPSSAPTANQVLVWLRYAPSAHACLMHTASGSALPPSHGHVGHHSSFTTVPSSTLRQGQETWQTGTVSSLFHCLH